MLIRKELCVICKEKEATAWFQTKGYCQECYREHISHKSEDKEKRSGNPSFLHRTILKQGQNEDR